MGNYTSSSSNTNNNSSNSFDATKNDSIGRNIAVIYHQDPLNSIVDDDCVNTKNLPTSSSASSTSTPSLMYHSKQMNQEEFEMKNFHTDNGTGSRSNNKSDQLFDDNDMKLMILSSFDVFINHILQEKLAKMDQSTSSDGGKEMIKLSKTHPHHFPYKESSTKSVFDNLAQMLSTHLDDYLASCKRSGIVTAPAYKSFTENFDHHHHHHHTVKNLKSKETSFQDGHLHLSSAYSINELMNNNNNNDDDLTTKANNSLIEHHYDQTTRRTSLVVNNSNSNHNGGGKFNNLSTQDSIRINLPEILDQQDEISILRLLIKLLSGKVRKLNDENRFLLQQIGVLNDINIELSTILQHKFEK
ncbi:hypothetical protein DERF_010256 [Dermatophagoides farinae]|uniref:Uncharacterized protein n=1 Tax=Dermatophagoides farinae TaxID=6954 RepID=A0A922HWT7_DERFA|nr:hypothetical protein DERF_010256 [Dermatophagoides farinae]